jgi:hypothetical protein
LGAILVIHDDVLHYEALKSNLFDFAGDELVSFLKTKWLMLKQVHFILLSIVFFVAGFLSSCSPKPQSDCGFVQNIYGQRISWKERLPIKITIHSSVPAELKSAIYRAAATWDTQIGKKVFEISEDSSQLSASPSRDQKNAIYFLSNWESDRTSEQGRTSVYWAGDEIQEADIRINAYDFSYYDQNPRLMVGSARLKNEGLTKTEGYSFEALLLHEMGHFLGLKHREGTSVMATHLAAFSNRVQLASTDQEAITCEYK